MVDNNKINFVLKIYGYLSGSLALAYYVNSYNVFNMLAENEFSRDEIEWTFSKNSSSKCSKFLYDNPVIHRKSAVLEPLLSKSIPYSSLNTPKFLHKMENKIKIDDYEDRVNAPKSFLKSISTEGRNKLQRQI